MNGQIYGIIPNIDIYRNLWVDGARNLWEVMELNKCEVTAQPNEKHGMVPSITYHAFFTSDIFGQKLVYTSAAAVINLSCSCKSNGK
jgi:hypothetical protein